MDDGASAMDARLLGQTLGGSYRVLRRIGAGGMGQVYEAEHTLLGRHFALKVLDTSQKTRRDAVSRFFAEARAASQIEHPHIVDVVNFVTDGPYMVLVMELLRGESLAERLTRGPLPILEASAILGQVCEAVAATHAAGILHRDLKPGNVFLTQVRGATHAKVLDYGIAKLKHAGAESGGEGQAAGVTTTGQLLGTPRYLSPEQARGSLHIDERADVYAAGVMLFEMLAGRPPFEGHNAFQLIWKHGNEPAPPLSAHAPGIPAELSDVVARALAKEPEERFHSMLALRDAVRDATSALVERPEPPPLPKSRRRPLRDARRGRCWLRCWAWSWWAPRCCSPWTAPTCRPANRWRAPRPRTPCPCLYGALAHQRAAHRPGRAPQHRSRGDAGAHGAAARSARGRGWRRAWARARHAAGPRWAAAHASVLGPGSRAGGAHADPHRGR